MIHIALCDDDQRFLYKCDNLLKASFSNYGCRIKTELFYDGKSLIEQVEKKQKVYDIICLDIKMPIIGGFPVAEKLRSTDNDFCLLFITQMKIIPKQVFKYNVFRYIDKDSVEDDLRDAIEGYLEKNKRLILNDEIVTFTYHFLNEIKELTVKKKDILYLEVIKRRVWLFTKYGEYELHTYTLRKYWEKLGCEHFMIVSRKYCVNLAHVVELRGDFFKMSNHRTICIGSTDRIKEKVALSYGKYRRGMI